MVNFSHDFEMPQIYTSVPEPNRRLLVRAISIYLFLIPLEGILRKWVLTPVEQPLIFIRDPIVIWMICYYSLVVRRIPGWFIAWAVGCVIYAVLAFIQLATVNPSPLALVVGLRNYLLFLPLAFIMREILIPKELAHLCKQILWMAIPIGILVALQFVSPVSSSINRGLSDDIDDRFTVALGIVRPYGPFTFTAGHVTFSLLLITVLLIAVSRKKTWLISANTLMLQGIFVLTSGALSGSRAYFVSAAFTALVFFFSGLLTGRAKTIMRQFLGSILAITTFLAIFTIVFPSAFQSMLERQTAASYSEGGSSDRVLGLFGGGIEALSIAPFIGLGIGVGSNGGAYISSGQRDFTIAENEWTRVIFELGPLFGSVMLLSRVVIIVITGWMCLQSLIRHRDASGLIALSFVAPVFLVGQISSQNQIMAISWFGLGICLCFANSGYRLRKIHTSTSL
jgi:hypothetical protein